MCFEWWQSSVCIFNHQQGNPPLYFLPKRTRCDMRKTSVWFRQNCPVPVSSNHAHCFLFRYRCGIYYRPSTEHLHPCSIHNINQQNQHTTIRISASVFHFSQRTPQQINNNNNSFYKHNKSNLKQSPSDKLNSFF